MGRELGSWSLGTPVVGVLKTPFRVQVQAPIRDSVLSVILSLSAFVHSLHVHAA